MADIIYRFSTKAMPRVGDTIKDEGLKSIGQVVKIDQKTGNALVRYKNLRVRTKDHLPQEQMQQAPPEAVPQGPPPEAGPIEPYGAQVLKRIHQDTAALLADYEEMMGALDNEAVKGHMTEKMKLLTREISMVEKLFKKTYKELGPLNGQDPNAPVDESMEELPPDEESFPDESMGDVDQKYADPLNDNAMMPADSTPRDYPSSEEAAIGSGFKCLLCGVPGCACGAKAFFVLAGKDTPGQKAHTVRTAQPGKDPGVYDIVTEFQYTPQEQSQHHLSEPLSRVRNSQDYATRGPKEELDVYDEYTRSYSPQDTLEYHNNAEKPVDESKFPSQRVDKTLPGHMKVHTNYRAVPNKIADPNSWYPQQDSPGGYTIIRTDSENAQGDNPSELGPDYSHYMGVNTGPKETLDTLTSNQQRKISNIGGTVSASNNAEKPIDESKFPSRQKAVRPLPGERNQYDHTVKAMPGTDLWHEQEVEEQLAEPAHLASQDDSLTNHWALEPAHEPKVREAVDFLKEISDPLSMFEDEHRMKAYHYHKTLEPIGSISGSDGISGSKAVSRRIRQTDREAQNREAQAPKVEQGGRTFDSEQEARLAGSRSFITPDETSVTPNKDKDMDSATSNGGGMSGGMGQGMNDLNPEEDYMTKYLEGKKKIAEASGYFKELAFEKAFGDPHRQKALLHSSALETLFNITTGENNVGDGLGPDELWDYASFTTGKKGWGDIQEDNQEPPGEYTPKEIAAGYGEGWEDGPNFGNSSQFVPTRNRTTAESFPSLRDFDLTESGTTDEQVRRLLYMTTDSTDYDPNLKSLEDSLIAQEDEFQKLTKTLESLVKFL